MLIDSSNNKHVKGVHRNICIGDPSEYAEKVLKAINTSNVQERSSQQQNIKSATLQRTAPAAVN